MELNGREFGLPAGRPATHSHICAFFNSADEEQRVVEPFLREGLASGAKSIYIIDPGVRELRLNRLREARIDVDGFMAAGQLDIIPWDEAYLRDGQFDQFAMLSWADNLLREYDARYSRTRAVAHMEWALLGSPGVEDLLQYEARVNHMLRGHSASVICAYDASRFPASVAMDVMRTHPQVIIGGVLQENPFFVPPDELLSEIREARSRRVPERATRETVISPG